MLITLGESLYLLEKHSKPKAQTQALYVTVLHCFFGVFGEKTNVHLSFTTALVGRYLWCSVAGLHSLIQRFIACSRQLCPTTRPISAP